MEEDRKTITFLKFIATLLITNSHLDGLYIIPALATGGSIGNAIFFMVSGYTLNISRNRNISLSMWYLKRIKRIYPQFICICFLFCAINYKYLYGFLDIVKIFIFPTNYWFIPAIMIFYLAYYFIIKIKIKEKFVICILLLCIPYLYIYFNHLNLSQWTIETGYFKWIFYFQTMLLGGFLSDKRSIKSDKTKGWLLLIMIMFYFVCKYLINKETFIQFQIIVHIITFLIIILLYRYVRDFIIFTKFINFKITNKLIVLLSSLTLEIYLVQSFVYNNRLVKNIVFPLNILVCWILIILGAFLLHKTEKIANDFGISKNSSIIKS